MQLLDREYGPSETFSKLFIDWNNVILIEYTSGQKSYFLTNLQSSVKTLTHKRERDQGKMAVVLWRFIYE